MPAVYEHRLLVVPEWIDELGHVNNLAYLEWMLEAALAHSAAQGWPTRRHLELGSGWVVRAHRIKYLRPAREGDQVTVRTWVAAGTRVTSTRRYDILRNSGDLLLAQAETEWAYINFATGAPMRIPPEVAEAFPIVDQPDLHS